MPRRQFQFLHVHPDDIAVHLAHHPRKGIKEGLPADTVDGAPVDVDNQFLGVRLPVPKGRGHGPVALGGGVRDIVAQADVAALEARVKLDQLARYLAVQVGYHPVVLPQSADRRVGDIAALD